MAYKSNTVDIIRVSKESDLYEVFANTNTISKFMTGTTEDYTLAFSPLTVSVEFYDRKVKQDLVNIDYRFRVLSDDNWDEFYAGDDGTNTYYIDMVERKFARSSTSPFDKRYDLLDDVDEMFEVIRNETN